jgi:hypothetical protein
MRLSPFTATPLRTTGHWVLTGLASGLLVAVFAFAWWFGPESADVAFALWAAGSVPLLVAAYSRTRSKALLAIAGVLCLVLFAAVSVGRLYERLDTLKQVEWSMTVLIALPFIVTVAWLARFHAYQRAGSDTRGRTLKRPAAVFTLVVTGVIVLAGAARWSHDGLRERTEDPLSAARYTGCYEVRLGRWVPSRMRGHGVGGIVPERLRLDTARGAPLLDSAGRQAPRQYYRDHEFGQRLIRPGWWGAAYWEPVEGDRARLYWTTGLHGVIMDLRPRGDELRGLAIGFTDVSGTWPDPRARVRAVRVDCSVVGPDTAVARGIQLQRQVAP